MTSVARQRQRPLQSGADLRAFEGPDWEPPATGPFGHALVGHSLGAFRAATLSGWGLGALDLPRFKAPALGWALLQR